MIAAMIDGLARLATGATARWLVEPRSESQRVYFANHASHFDFITIWAALPPPQRAHTRPVAAADYWMAGRIKRYLAARVFRALLIDRSGGDNARRATEQMVGALREGDSLIIFPEGTRGDGSEIAPLHGRQHDAYPQGVPSQPSAALWGYGYEIGKEAERRLIEYLAAELHRGPIRPALTILESCTDARPPPGVPQEEWREFLTACLLRSGVMTFRGRDLVFLHQTLLEYLAACHIVRDPRARAVALDGLLHSRWSRHWPWSPVPGFKRWAGWGMRLWPPMRKEDLSYNGFLLDNGVEPATDMTNALRLLATRGRLDGCMFLAAQVHMGTELPPIVVQTTTNTLVSLAVPTRLDERRVTIGELLERPDQLDPHVDFALWEAVAATAIDDSRVLAAGALVQLGDERGATVLAHLACSPHLVTGLGRVEAAAKLAGIGDERGADLLAGLASDTCLKDWHRIQAAGVLAQFDQRGLDLLVSWAQLTGSADDEFRVQSAGALAEIGDKRGFDFLADIACDTAGKVMYRLHAAYLLATFGDERGADLLATFARDSALTGPWRLRAASMLAESCDERASDTYAFLARDATLKRRQRRYADRASSSLAGHPGM